LPNVFYDIKINVQHNKSKKRNGNFKKILCILYALLFPTSTSSSSSALVK
jgi:hypothetical protein